MDTHLLIIVEGADGAGKSTAIQHIANAIKRRYPADDLKILHAGPPRSHPLDEYEVPLLTYSPGTQQHIICDRWHLGEWVYPEIFNRPTLRDRATWMHIHMFLASRGAIIVHIDPSDDIIYKRVSSRGDDMVTARQSVDAAQMYRNIITSVPMVNVISVLGINTKFEANRIITSGQTAEHQISDLRLNPTYVGPQKPKFLLVDHTNMNPLNRPTLMPYTDTFGQHILETIPTTLVTILGLICWSASDDLEDTNFRLSSPKIIALGQNTQRLLQRTHSNTSLMFNTALISREHTDRDRIQHVFKMVMRDLELGT